MLGGRPRILNSCSFFKLHICLPAGFLCAWDHWGYPKRQELSTTSRQSQPMREGSWWVNTLAPWYLGETQLRWFGPVLQRVSREMDAHPFMGPYQLSSLACLNSLFPPTPPGAFS